VGVSPLKDPRGTDRDFVPSKIPDYGFWADSNALLVRRGYRCRLGIEEYENVARSPPRNLPNLRNVGKDNCSMPRPTSSASKKFPETAWGQVAPPPDPVPGSVWPACKRPGPPPSSLHETNTNRSKRGTGPDLPTPPAHKLEVSQACLLHPKASAKLR